MEGQANSFFTKRLEGGISQSISFHSNGCLGGDSERGNEEAAQQKMKQKIGGTRREKKRSDLAELSNEDGVLLSLAFFFFFFSFTPCCKVLKVFGVN